MAHGTCTPHPAPLPLRPPGPGPGLAPGLAPAATRWVGPPHTVPGAPRPARQQSRQARRKKGWEAAPGRGAGGEGRERQEEGRKREEARVEGGGRGCLPHAPPHAPRAHGAVGGGKVGFVAPLQQARAAHRAAQLRERHRRG